MAYLVSHPDEVRVVSKRFGLGATNLDRYLELDGYKALQKAISMAPDAIINEVKASNLRGVQRSSREGRPKVAVHSFSASSPNERRHRTGGRLGQYQDAR